MPCRANHAVHTVILAAFPSRTLLLSVSDEPPINGEHGWAQDEYHFRYLSQRWSPREKIGRLMAIPRDCGGTEKAVDLTHLLDDVNERLDAYCKQSGIRLKMFYWQKLDAVLQHQVDAMKIGHMTNLKTASFSRATCIFRYSRSRQNRSRTCVDSYHPCWPVCHCVGLLQAVHSY
jgi:hypothetical protein